MKKLLQKYILGMVATAFALSAGIASAQLSISACVNSSGQQGTLQGGICIASGAAVGGAAGTQQRMQANNADLGVISNLIKQIQNLVSMLVPLAIGIAIVWFMFNLIKYFMASDDAEGKGKAMKNAGYGLLAIFIMVSIWGVIAFLNSATGVNQGGTSQLPTIPTYQN